MLAVGWLKSSCSGHALGALDLDEQDEHPGVAGHAAEFGFHI
jgi:hypothetical protein